VRPEGVCPLYVINPNIFLDFFKRAFYVPYRNIPPFTCLDNMNVAVYGYSHNESCEVPLSDGISIMPCAGVTRQHALIFARYSTTSFAGHLLSL
jgi:hypothetical protein